MPDVEQVIETQSAKIWLDEAGIVRAVFKPNQYLTLEHAVENFEAMQTLIRGGACFYLADLRNVVSTTKPHRDYFSQEHITQLIIAAALIAGTPISNMLGNFFLFVTRPPIKSRLFTDEENAIAWLKEQMESATP